MTPVIVAANEAAADPAASLALAVVAVIALIGVALLLPWIRAQIIATRDAVISPSGRTVSESTQAVEHKLSTLTTRVENLAVQAETQAARTSRAEQWVAGVDSRVTDLGARVGSVESATARAHQRIDMIATHGGTP